MMDLFLYDYWASFNMLFEIQDVLTISDNETKVVMNRIMTPGLSPSQDMQ